MVLFDATTLLLLLSPNAAPPIDRKTGHSISDAGKRIDFLVKTLEKQKTKIIVPTPALSEILVKAGPAAPSYIRLLSQSAAFKIVPFDIRAAIEVAEMTCAAKVKGDKKSGSDDIWTKVKYDRQIIGIGRVENVTAIYTDDANLRNFAEALSIPVIGVSDLQLPPEDPQTEMEL